MERIRQLQEQEKDIVHSLKEIHEFIQQEYERYVAETYKVKPGTIVNNQAGKLYRVHSIAHTNIYEPKPWLSVNPQKKDGDFSKQIHRLYNWEVVE